MSNYFILSSGNFGQNIHCISNAATDVTSSSASFYLPVSAIATTSTTGHTSPIRAVALALSARSADSSGEISLKVTSPTNTAVYVYAISSLLYYKYVNNLNDNVHQNLTVFNFPEPFQITSSESLSYELSASRENAITVVGDIDLNSKLNINRCTIISVPLENNINITTTKALVSTEDNISRLTFARASSHFFSGTINSRFNLSNDFTLGISFTLNTPPTGSTAHGLFSISNTGLTTLSGFNVLLNNSTIYVRVNNTIYGEHAHGLEGGSSCTYICTKQGNELSFFINGVYQSTVSLTSAASAIPTGNTIYIGSGNNVTQSNAVSTTFFNGSISTIVFNSSSCLYNSNTRPANSTELPSPFVPGTVAYLSPSASYNFNKLTYSLSASPIVDDLRITTPLHPLNISFPNTSVSVSACGLMVSGNLYIYNNAILTYRADESNNIFVNGNKGIHINNNSYLNLSANEDKQSAIYLQRGGLNIGDGGNVNIYGAARTSKLELPTTLPVGSSALVYGDSWYELRVNDIIIFNLNTFQTISSVISLSGFSYNDINTSNTLLSTGYHIARVTETVPRYWWGGNCCNGVAFFTPSISQYKNIDTLNYTPDIVNITRNIIISGANTSSYIKPYIHCFNSSKSFIQNTNIINIGNPYINQTGIINSVDNQGSFLLKNSVIRNVLSLPSNMPQDINPYAYPQGITTASANLYSLYISPNTTNNFISPDVRNTALTGNYTIDFWTYTLGSSNNNNGVIFSWGEVVNSTTNPATANFYSKLQLTKSTTNNSLKLSYSDNTTGYYTDIITANNSIIAGVWYHIAITCSNNIIKLWIDGILMGSGYINSVYPTVYDALSGESTYGNLMIGGDTVNTGYDGYIFDFRINLQQNIEPSSAGLITPLSALSSDYFRLNRTSTLLADSSTFNRSISCNKPLYAKMVNFSPFSQSINNTTITDNIFVQNTEKNIYLHHTTLNNVTISGNIMLSCANTNVYFDSISAIAVNMKDNFINPPYLSANPNIIFKNCSSTDNTIIGGVVTYNNVVSPGIMIEGSNQGKIGNILSYNNKNVGILIEPTNNYNKVLFNNITCISNEIHGVSVNNILNLPLTLSGNNIQLNNNINTGLVVDNSIKSISNFTINNNLRKSLFLQKNTQPINIKNLTIINDKNYTVTRSDINFYDISNFGKDSIVAKKILNNDTFKFNNFVMQCWVKPSAQTLFNSSSNSAMIPAGLHCNYFHFGVGRTTQMQNRVVFAWWNPSSFWSCSNAGINFTANYSYYVSTETVLVDQWSHIAACIDQDGNISLYINGIKATQLTSILSPVPGSGCGTTGLNRTSPARILNNTHKLRAAVDQYTVSNPNITDFSVGRFTNNGRSPGQVVGNFDLDLKPGVVATYSGEISGISIIDNYSYKSNFIPPKSNIELLNFYPVSSVINLITQLDESTVNIGNNINTEDGGISFIDSDSLIVNIEETIINTGGFSAPICFNNSTISELSVNKLTAISKNINNILIHNLNYSNYDNSYSVSGSLLPSYNKLINANININNSKLDNFSVTNLLSNSAIKISRGIAFTNYDQISGKNITYLSHGTRETNINPANVGAVASPSEKLTPTSRNIKLNSSSKFVAVPEGMSISEVSVYVRKSTVADGAAYNGSAPRLMLKSNPSIGIYNDTLLHTEDEPSGSYYKLEGIGLGPAIIHSVYEFYVDCDGTAGWIDVDSWSAT